MDLKTMTISDWVFTFALICVFDWIYSSVKRMLFPDNCFHLVKELEKARGELKTNIEYQNSLIIRIVEYRLKIAAMEAKLKNQAPESKRDDWWNARYNRPKQWGCPKCDGSLNKEKLRWNWMLSENVCPRCGNPQRQHAVFSDAKKSE